MQPGPIALALAFTAALLFAEHVALWAQPWRVQRPWNYVIGVATLAAGWVVWGLTASAPVTPIDAAISIVLISFGSGAVIVLCYAVRARMELSRKNSATIIEARALTQDLIDEGKGHAAGKPSLRDRSRDN